MLFGFGWSGSPALHDIDIRYAPRSIAILFNNKQNKSKKIKKKSQQYFPRFHSLRTHLWIFEVLYIGAVATSRKSVHPIHSFTTTTATTFIFVSMATAHLSRMRARPVPLSHKANLFAIFRSQLSDTDFLVATSRYTQNII